MILCDAISSVTSVFIFVGSATTFPPLKFKLKMASSWGKWQVDAARDDGAKRALVSYKQNKLETQLVFRAKKSDQ